MFRAARAPARARRTGLTASRTTPFFLICAKHGYSPTYEIRALTDCAGYQSIDVFLEYIKATELNFTIIGQEYFNVIKAMPDECRDFRSALATARLEAMDEQLQHDRTILAENEYVFVESEPPITDDPLIMIDGRLEDDSSRRKTLAQRKATPVQVVIAELFDKLRLMCHDSPLFAGASGPGDFVLKVRGSYEFLIPLNRQNEPFCLGDFDYVRRCVHRRQKLDLVLFTRSTLHQTMCNDRDLALATHFNRFVAQDRLTAGASPGSCLSQRDATVEFTVFLNALDNVTLTTTVKASGDLVEQRILRDFRAYVCAELYYSSRRIGQSVFTPVLDVANAQLVVPAPIPLTFDIMLLNIPRETRLIFTVYMTDLPRDAPVALDPERRVRALLRGQPDVRKVAARLELPPQPPRAKRTERDQRDDDQGVDAHRPDLETAERPFASPRAVRRAAKKRLDAGRSPRVAFSPTAACPGRFPELDGFSLPNRRAAVRALRKAILHLWRVRAEWFFGIGNGVYF